MRGMCYEEEDFREFDDPILVERLLEARPIEAFVVRFTCTSCLHDQDFVMVPSEIDKLAEGRTDV
jgi:hypothetical protein